MQCGNTLLKYVPTWEGTFYVKVLRPEVVAKRIAIPPLLKIPWVKRKLDIRFHCFRHVSQIYGDSSLTAEGQKRGHRGGTVLL